MQCVHDLCSHVCSASTLAMATAQEAYLQNRHCLQQNKVFYRACKMRIVKTILPERHGSSELASLLAAVCQLALAALASMRNQACTIQDWGNRSLITQERFGNSSFKPPFNGKQICQAA